MPPKKRGTRAKKNEDPGEIPAATLSASSTSPVILGHRNTTATPKQKRKLAESPMIVDEESDIDGEEGEGFLEVQTERIYDASPKTPTAKDSNKKRLKVSARGDLHTEPTIQIEWVPTDMRGDIFKANNKGNLEEVYSCVRWFDALLVMFWKSDIKEVQEFIEGQFEIWKVTSLANARRSLAKVGFEEVNRPIIWENEVLEYFLKNKMRLIHDVWSNVLDVLEPEYLFTNEIWGARFMQSTVTILCWLITYTFRLENPMDMISTAKSTGVTPLGAKDKTTCILNFPDGLQKPASWNRKWTACPWYGELEGSGQLQEQVAEEVINELRTELLKSEVKLLERDDDFDEDKYLNTMELEQDVENMCQRVQRKTNAFERLEKKSMERRGVFGAEILEEKVLRDREVEALIWKFLEDVKNQYEASEIEERASVVEVRAMNPKIPNTLEVIGTFGMWMARMKKEQWFVDCMKAHETSLIGNMSVYEGVGGMQLGNRASSMQVGNSRLAAESNVLNLAGNGLSLETLAVWFQNQAHMSRGEGLQARLAIEVGQVIQPYNSIGSNGLGTGSGGSISMLSELERGANISKESSDSVV
ncbi:hypothetical protein L211DRAFT_851585 [Terfezia boudieri ATCC MYA-4762]|uniref:Uncharacterized protein n=1 Tax=Terfezia boudieri ATCC MYA-4762 TaxID=1051890 RepID=A0A3N4LEB0_9PEZI|nr:hypothetical protein L211DRAFT_851585 [Terfezia boudieri ATCC MYA-4762]